MIKLREILKMPVFEEFRIVAGERGIDRDISTVSVMDAPDIYQWMKGGEFLITSAYVVKDCPGYIKSLVENLDQWGASALGVKFDRFIHEFTKMVLKDEEIPSILYFLEQHIHCEVVFVDTCFFSYPFFQGQSK